MRVNYSKEDIPELRLARWKGRTDLRYLAREILGMKDIEEDVHGPVIDFCQKFRMPPPEIAAQMDIVTPGYIEFMPDTFRKAAQKDKNLEFYMDKYSLEGPRRRLLIDSRGFLKTSLNCVAHTIQWLLNYPDMAILIFQANLDKGRDILREIKAHFQFNQVFREIYPDYCPHRRIDEWGNQDEAILPNRQDKTRKEPSLRVASISKGVAGGHYCIMKFTDVVDEDNSQTETQVKKIVFDFFQRENLLVKMNGWIDVEGTRYDFRDLYGQIVDRWIDEENFPGYRDHWSIFLRGCYKRKDADFSPLDLAKDYEKDAKGKRVPVWATRFPLDVLERQERDEPVAFACQRLNDPVSLEAGAAVFPLKKYTVNGNDMAGLPIIKLEDFRKIQIAFRTTTVDTASTQNMRSHHSVVTTCAWDWAGRCYVEDVRLGKFQVDELLNHVFDAYVRFKPQSVTVEETEFVKGLKPSFGRYEAKLRIKLPFNFVPRETNLSKEDRIRNTLRPWWMLGEIYFLDNLKHQEHIKLELQRFPKFMNDFLDTLADQFQTREWFGRLQPRPEPPKNFDEIAKKAQEESFRRRMLGLKPGEQQGYKIPVPMDPLLAKTGGL